MPLFKVFYKIAWRMLPGISIYFIIYAALTFLMGTTSQKNIDTNFQMQELSICVMDEDNSLSSHALTAYLDSIHKLVPLENDPEVLQDHLYYRHIVYVLTIPDGFEENLTAGETENLLTNVKVPGSACGHFIDQQITQYLDSLRLYLNGGYSLEDAVAATGTALAQTNAVKSLMFEPETAAPKKEVFYFYQYLPYILIVFLICGMAPILATFNRKDLANRISCSASSHRNRSFQLILCSILYAILSWVSFFLLCFIAYGRSVFVGNALYALLNSFVFLLVAASFAFFASFFALDNGIANMISNVFGLGMSFLCGVFVPQSMLSDEVLTAAKFLPAYWYIRANNMLAGFSNESFDLQFYWTALGIQLLFAVAVFTVAMVVSRIRREKA